MHTSRLCGCKATRPIARASECWGGVLGINEDRVPVPDLRVYIYRRRRAGGVVLAPRTRWQSVVGGRGQGNCGRGGQLQHGAECLRDSVSNCRDPAQHAQQTGHRGAWVHQLAPWHAAKTSMSTLSGAALQPRQGQGAYTYIVSVCLMRRLGVRYRYRR